MKKTKSQKKLLKDVKKMKRDYEKLEHFKKLIKDKRFLKKIAEDIKKLNEDAIVAKSTPNTEPMGKALDHALTAPWGTPLTGDKNLLEAALTFEYQTAQNSDLSHIMENILKHGHEDSELLIILDSLYDKLR